MTIVIGRQAGLLAMLAAAGVLLAACGSGPSQVGSAVIIGDTAISVDQVQRELNDVVNTQATAKQNLQQGKLDQTSRGIVTAHVLHELITSAAARDHLSAPDQQVDQLISSSGGLDKVAGSLSVDSANTREVVRDVLLEVALARKYSTTLAVKFNYISANSRADAIAKANQLAADPGSIGKLVQSATASGGAGQQGVGISLAQFLQQPQGQLGPLFAAQPNTVVTFQLDPTQGPQWIVAQITDRTAVDPATAPAGPAATSSDLATLEGIGVDLLQQDAKNAGIRVSPRYGVWDPVGMQVVAGADQTIGVDVPLHGPRA